MYHRESFWQSTRPSTDPSRPFVACREELALIIQFKIDVDDRPV